MLRETSFSYFYKMIKKSEILERKTRKTRKGIFYTNHWVYEEVIIIDWPLCPWKGPVCPL